jgi:vancomycin resistance protein VanW
MQWQMLQAFNKPAFRALRRRLGRHYYRWKRYGHWWLGSEKWAEEQIKTPLPYEITSHASILLRRLKDVEMYLQHNKVTNLRLAAQPVSGLLIRPGETFSFWKRVGNPTRQRGFLTGLVLESGKISTGTGGGLCQMGNLLYWMALHSPLTVVERWRHSYDVFPDEGRTLPFGSGATLAYNYIDLQLRNDTPHTFQIVLAITDTHLTGAIRCDADWPLCYEVTETYHEMRAEPHGGYSRHNRLLRTTFDRNTHTPIATEVVAENHALMMYPPFLR